MYSNPFASCCDHAILVIICLTTKITGKFYFDTSQCFCRYKTSVISFHQLIETLVKQHPGFRKNNYKPQNIILTKLCQ